MYGSHYKLLHLLCVEVLHNILQSRHLDNGREILVKIYKFDILESILSFSSSFALVGQAQYN